MLINNAFIRRNWRSIFTFFAYVIDSVAVFSSGIVAWYLLGIVRPIAAIPRGTSFMVIASFWLILSFLALIIGLYRLSYPANSRIQFVMATKSYLYAIPFILITFYFLGAANVTRSYILLYLFLIPVHFLIGRGLLVSLSYAFQRIGLGKYNSLVMANGAAGGDISYQFRYFPKLGFDIKGLIFNPDGNKSSGATFLGRKIPVYKTSQLDSIIRKEHIDRIFIPSPSYIINGFHELVDKCRLYNIKLKVVSPEANSLLRMARVYDIAGITLYTPTRHRIDLVKRIVKRLFDIIGSAALILILSPILILTSLAILLETGRPIVYAQKRTSIKGGREFRFFKFRSMVKNAEEIRDYLTDFNESGGALFKMKNDPRITRVGKFIRKFSIDELPQLFNVLIGNMSLVGPRPLPTEDYQKVNTDDNLWEAFNARAKVKPGVTGLWQISGRSDISFNEMVLLDLYYVEHQSLLFDLEILFETIPTVLFSRGAY